MSLKIKQAPILFITHDLGVINQMADDVAVMYCGQVVEKAPVGHIFGGESKYSHPYTEGLLSSIPALLSERRLLRPFLAQFHILSIYLKAVALLLDANMPLKNVSQRCQN